MKGPAVESAIKHNIQLSRGLKCTMLSLSLSFNYSVKYLWVNPFNSCLFFLLLLAFPREMYLVVVHVFFTSWASVDPPVLLPKPFCIAEGTEMQKTKTRRQLASYVSAGANKCYKTVLELPEPHLLHNIWLDSENKACGKKTFLHNVKFTDSGCQNGCGLVRVSKRSCFWLKQHNIMSN